MDAALAGIRVIAVEQAVAGPLCSRHLADLGADVIKIERPGAGDFARGYDDYVLGTSSHFTWLNRGKRSLAVDVKSEAGVAVLKALLAQADVLVCNLAPGAFHRLIDAAELAAGNPGLIRCFLSGYGPAGPFADRKAYDLLIQGEAGTVTATGTPEVPAKPGVSMADLAGGSYALSAILAALVARGRTGLGQEINIALFDVLLEWMSPLILAERYHHPAPLPAGVHHASIAPYGPYRTGDGKEILVAVQNEGQWQRLCQRVLAAPDLAADPRFTTNTLRVRHRADLEAAVGAAFAAVTSEQALSALAHADVPYASMNQIADVLSHEQAAATGRWSPAVLPTGEQVTVVTSPFHPGAEHIEAARAVPAVGQHSREILREYGYSPEAITTLLQDGVITG
ncbi:MAG: carnitine dehydratase [Mycobacterium sp.]|nr:carnitine dehydratase [Mycobacterium sp.]